MAETVNNLKIQVIITGTVVGDDGAQLPVSMVKTVNFADGVGDNQVSKVWQDITRDLDTASEDLDLGTGGLDAFQGDDLVAPKLKVLFLDNLSTTSGQALTLKDGSTNDANPMTGTTPALPVGPDGFILIVNPIDGYTITDGSADVIGVETSADMSYRVLLAG